MGAESRDRGAVEEDLDAQHSLGVRCPGPPDLSCGDAGIPVRADRPARLRRAGRDLAGHLRRPAGDPPERVRGVPRRIFRRRSASQQLLLPSSLCQSISPDPGQRGDDRRVSARRSNGTWRRVSISCSGFRSGEATTGRCSGRKRCSMRRWRFPTIPRRSLAADGPGHCDGQPRALGDRGCHRSTTRSGCTRSCRMPKRQGSRKCIHPRCCGTTSNSTRN